MKETPSFVRCRAGSFENERRWRTVLLRRNHWRVRQAPSEARLSLTSSILHLGMNADVVIGERRMKRLTAKRRHVASDAATLGIDRTWRATSLGTGTSGQIHGRGRRRCGSRMAVQTPGRGVCRLELVVAMRVVAGRAVKRTAALRVAAAPGEGRRLKANPERIGARQRRFRVIGMALAA